MFKKRRKRSKKAWKKEKSMEKKPEGQISQTKCKKGCVYHEKNFANNSGDRITSLVGIKDMPKADAKVSG